MPNFVDESSFKRALSLECKRSERTGMDLLLVLLNGEGEAISKVVGPLSAAFRDTDVAGWHQCHSTIGVMLTALSGAARPTIRSAISTRITDILARDLRPEQIQRVDLKFFFYPDEGDAKFNKVFFSD